MANIKVQDYPNAAAIIAGTDIFDLTVDLGAGAFESKRLTFAVLKAVLLGFRRFKISKDFNDFNVVAFEKNIEIFSLPAGFKKTEIVQKHEILWSGGGINSVTSEVGIAGVGNENKYADPFDIKQAPGGKIFTHDINDIIEDFEFSTSIKATIKSVDDTLDQLTQGTIDYYIYIEQFK